MKVQLSAQSERVIPYQYFGDDRVVDLMPQLIKAGYVPAGVAVLVDRCQYAPEEVRANFDICFWTGDSTGTDEKGGVLLTLDSPLLRQLTPESTLVNGALKLDNKQWKELKANKEHSLYLNPQEIEDAHEKGYVLKNDGKFVPTNKTVAKVWNHLNRGKDLQNYAQMVSEASKNSYVMRLFFDKSQPSTPTLRSLVVDMISDNSYVLAPTFLNNHHGRLAGVAAHVTRAVKNQGSYRTPASVPRSELEVVLDEFKMADPTELRKALQLYDKVKNLKQ